MREITFFRPTFVFANALAFVSLSVISRKGRRSRREERANRHRNVNKSRRVFACKSASVDAPLDRARNERVPRENPLFARVTHRVAGESDASVGKTHARKLACTHYALAFLAQRVH